MWMLSAESSRFTLGSPFIPIKALLEREVLIAVQSSSVCGKQLAEEMVNEAAKPGNLPTEPPTACSEPSPTTTSLEQGSRVVASRAPSQRSPRLYWWADRRK